VARDIEQYIHLTYAVEVVPDSTTDGMLCYRASHPELPGCMAHGETPEEALENLEDAKRLYVETLVAKNLEIPLPKSAPGVTASRAGEVIWTILNPSGEAEERTILDEADYVKV
jgi:predicted RNase H-like HicB family nuclease